MKNMKELLAGGSHKLKVSQYQEYIRDLYAEINAKRDFADLYGYLHRNIGYLGKSIELETDDQSKFILPISWLFSLATEINVNIMEALIKKFPGVCPYCLESHCRCITTNKKPSRPMGAHEVEEIMYFKWAEISSSSRDFTLDDAVDFISTIYPGNEVIWKTAGYHRHILKLHQEIAEIHEAFSGFSKGTKPIDAVSDEFADVFAWILSAWKITHPEDSLDRAFTDYYVHDCPVCGKGPCKCGLLDSRPATLPDFDKLDVIRQKLGELAEFYPGQRELSSLLKSYDSVTKNQSMPIAWAALIQTKESLERLRRTATTLDVEGKGSSTLNSVLNIVNAVLTIEGVQDLGEKDYDVFLSYSTANKDQVRTVFEFLTSNKIKVFMSERSIQPSSNWEEVIRDALKSSKLLCLVASPESLVSDWVKTEADSAWVLGIPTLPILYHCATKDLPDRLRRHQSIDYHEYPKIMDVLESLR